MGYSPQGRKESDTTESTEQARTHTLNSHDVMGQIYFS